MATITDEAITPMLTTGQLADVPRDFLPTFKNWLYNIWPKEGSLSLPTPFFSHDRTIVTIVVLLCGTALLLTYGDSAPIVALVSAGWTLALTFWFRFGTEPSSRDE